MACFFPSILYVACKNGIPLCECLCMNYIWCEKKKRQPTIGISWSSPHRMAYLRYWLWLFGAGSAVAAKADGIAFKNWIVCSKNWIYELLWCWVVHVRCALSFVFDGPSLYGNVFWYDCILHITMDSMDSMDHLMEWLYYYFVIHTLCCVCELLLS